MSCRTFALALCLAVVVPSAPSALAAAIGWQSSLEAALADAQARKAPVFIAVNMDGERANDEMVKVHYKDAVITGLAARCSSLFASVDDHDGESQCSRCGGPVTCSQHRGIEKVVRAKYLKVAADGGYVAPEHVFLDPEGKVLLSVPYGITVGELEWCFAAAIKAVDPTFVPKLSDDARPPRRLVNGGVTDPGGDATKPAPTKKEVDEILEELRKSKKIWDKLDLVMRLLRSPEKKAIDFFEDLLSGKMPNPGREEGLLGLLRAIGRLSPPDYAPLLHPFLADDRPKVKSTAIVSIEMLANPKSLGALNKAWKAEKDPEFQKDLIRALAACGPADAATEKTVLAQLAKDVTPLVRANAMLGAEHLANKKRVFEAVDVALAQQELPELRFAAGWVIASLRDDGRKPALESAAGRETEPRVQEALAACVGVLEGKPLASLEAYLADLLKSTIPRDRL